MAGVEHHVSSTGGSDPRTACCAAHTGRRRRLALVEYAAPKRVKRVS
jgi:hypothetical protein